jgi:hypothetical protein
MAGRSEAVGDLGDALVAQTTETARIHATAVSTAPGASVEAHIAVPPPGTASETSTERSFPQQVNDVLGFVLVIMGLVASAAIPLYALYLVIEFVLAH